MSGGLTVTGGVEGIAARTEDLRTASHLFRTSASGIDDVLTECARPMRAAAPDLAAAGFEVHLRIAATLGSAGHLARDLRHLGDQLTAAASLYEESENGIFATIWDGLGDVVGAGWHLAWAPATFTTTLLATGNPLTAGWAVAEDNLELIDIGMATAMITPPGRSAMIDLQLVPDGHPEVRGTGPDTRGAAARPPRGIADLMGALDRRNHGPHGAVDVRILAGADGRRRVIVDITGTKSWTAGTHDVTDLTTNARALIGRDTAYEQGVFAALRQAGVGPGEEIMLVGHSQGGMIAVDAARDARAHGFSVTHVVTAGSPIGITAGQVPRGVQVLALENRRDAVPHFDGRDNPDRPNVITVGFDDGVDSIFDEHGIGTSYRHGGQLVDASTDPGIRAFLDSSAAFFTATDVETRTFVVTRGY